MEHSKQGIFLIRQDGGKISLALYDGLQVWHYRINLRGSWFSIFPETEFRTLQDLIQHYSTNADGLTVKLTIPCPPLYSPYTISEK